MLNSPQSILQQYWGYAQFRPLQEEIIHSVLSDTPTLALLPTGGGKSICFQVPAMCMDGICIVVSPLIALMKDQVHQLKSRGIKAAALYSGMSHKEMDIQLDNCIYGDYKFLYVSPERLQSDLFRTRVEKMNVCLLAIDEAHCISQWGYDFRPPYLEIAEFKAEFRLNRVIALTASATKEVAKDILDKLHIPQAKIFKKSFARPNLSYSAINLEQKEEKMLDILQKIPGSSIVYVRNRKRTQEIAGFLNRNKISADYYHAGLSGKERSTRQDDWIANRTRVIVATNAFGMGIDKPDVRSVIHLDVPDSLEAYYQEAGRAGRDEKKAYAVMLYHENDLISLTNQLEKTLVSFEFVKSVYQALGNYFQLPIGQGQDQSFDFDYADFTSKFNLPAFETHYALKILADESLILQIDQGVVNSTLMITVSHEVCYQTQVKYPKLAPVIQALLRLYGGALYSQFVEIKEQELQQLLHKTRDEVILLLNQLANIQVINYQLSLGKSKLVFLQPRKAKIALNQKFILWRRDVARKKIASITNYVKSNHICRTRMIQYYFDEITDQDCGVCDSCSGKKRKISSLDLLTIFQQIPQVGILVNDLAASCKTEVNELLPEIRMLVEDGLVTVDASGLIRKKND